nr:mucin-1-like [Aegilops tauschii subsp. strangulata]
MTSSRVAPLGVKPPASPPAPSGSAPLEGLVVAAGGSGGELPSPTDICLKTRPWAAGAPGEGSAGAACPSTPPAPTLWLEGVTSAIGDAASVAATGEEGIEATCPGPPPPRPAAISIVGSTREGEEVEATCPGLPPLGTASKVDAVSRIETAGRVGERGATCSDSASPPPTEVITEKLLTKPPSMGLLAASTSKVGNMCSNTSSDSTRSLQSLGGAEAGSNDPNLRELIGDEEDGAVPSPGPSPGI